MPVSPCSAATENFWGEAVSPSLARRAGPGTGSVCHVRRPPCYRFSVDSGRSGLASQSVDWTGVEPDATPIEPLTAETFAARLNSLTDAVAALDSLKRAFDEQHGGSAR